MRICALLRSLFLVFSFLSWGLVVSNQNEDNLDSDADVVEEDALVDTDESIEQQATEEVISEDTTRTKLDEANIQLQVLFTDFPDKQLPAGKVIHALVGVLNPGPRDYYVAAIDASFRYPQDYSFTVQNFTMFGYNTLVPAGVDGSFRYYFHPHESYGGRPFGLVITVYLKDGNDQFFSMSAFNETIVFVELDEGFDTEAFFMYIFMAVIVGLTAFGIYYWMTQMKRKPLLKKTIETGTRTDHVDRDWLPKDLVDRLNKAQRTSPRLRKPKKFPSSGMEGSE